MTPLTCQDDRSNIPPVDRSTIRDTFLYAFDDRDTQLGGLYTSPGITNDNFHSMVEMICLFSDTFELCDENGQLVQRDDEQLQSGNYYIVTNGGSLLCSGEGENIGTCRGVVELLELVAILLFLIL